MSAGYRIFLIYLVLTFYCFGAAMMNEIVEYQSWADLGNYITAADFAKWHTATSRQTLPILVLPMIILTLTAISLIWFLPPVIPRWTLWIVLSCHAVAWCSTIFVQVPLEMQLSTTGCSRMLTEQLIQSDWIRKGAFFVEIPIVLFMTIQLFNKTLTSRMQS